MFLDGKRCFSLISVVHYSHSVVHCAYYDNSVANTFAIEPLPIDANLLKAFDISSFRIPKDLPYQPHPLVCPLPHRAWRCNLTKNGRTGFRFDPTMVVSMLSQQSLPCSLKSARYTPLMLKNTGKVQYGKKWLLKLLVMMVLKLRWPLGGSKVQRLSFEDCCCAHYCRDDTVTK